MSYKHYWKVGDLLTWVVENESGRIIEYARVPNNDRRPGWVPEGDGFHPQRGDKGVVVALDETGWVIVFMPRYAANIMICTDEKTMHRKKVDNENR